MPNLNFKEMCNIAGSDNFKLVNKDIYAMMFHCGPYEQNAFGINKGSSLKLEKRTKWLWMLFCMKLWFKKSYLF